MQRDVCPSLFELRMDSCACLACLLFVALIPFLMHLFSPLGQELLTPDGRGRPARDIGMLLNEKLVRLLARLVMREMVKTATLYGVMLTSFALDTDARCRQQNKHKSLSPPPLGRGRRASR